MISHGRILNGNLDITDPNKFIYSMTSNSYFEAILANQLEDYFYLIKELVTLDIDSYKDFCISYISNIEKRISDNSNNIDKLIYNIIYYTKKYNKNITNDYLVKYIYEQFFEIDSDELNRIKNLFYSKIAAIDRLYIRIFKDHENNLLSKIKRLNDYFTSKYSLYLEEMSFKDNYIMIKEIDCSIMVGKRQYQLPFNIIDLWQMIITYNFNIVIISHYMKNNENKWKLHDIAWFGNDIDYILTNYLNKFKNILLLCCNPNGYILNSEKLFNCSDRKLYYPIYNLLMESKTKESPETN